MEYGLTSTEEKQINKECRRLEKYSKLFLIEENILKDRIKLLKETQEESKGILFKLNQKILKGKK